MSEQTQVSCFTLFPVFVQVILVLGEHRYENLVSSLSCRKQKPPHNSQNVRLFFQSIIDITVIFYDRIPVLKH